MILPPLNALRAFESAGRHRNFSRAAAELHVTQGAVSRQIKLLEERLGIELFRRLPQGVEITESGRRLLAQVSEAFQLIARAAQQVSADRGEIRVICAPTLGSRWLAPRLRQFQSEHPHLRISMGVFRQSYEEFFAGNFDIGIDCADSKADRPDGLESQPFRREEMAPLCSPRLRDAGLKEPSDLCAQVLLHPEPNKHDWKRWLQAAGLTGNSFAGEQVFETMEMAVRVAIGGIGVVMGDLLLYQEELSAGQLVAPFDLSISEDSAYYLFARSGAFNEPRLAAFRDWIIAQANS